MTIARRAARPQDRSDLNLRVGQAHFGAYRERQAQRTRQLSGLLGITHVRRDDNCVRQILLLEMVDHHAQAGKVVERHVEEAVGLRRVQRHGDDAVRTRRLDHLRHQLAGNANARRVFFVRPAIDKIGHDGGHAGSVAMPGNIQHHHHLHQVTVHRIGE